MSQRIRVLVRGIRIGQIEVLRDWRTLKQDRIRIVLLVCGGLFLNLYLGLMALIVQNQTAEHVTRIDPSLPPDIGLLVTLLWLSSTVIFSQRAAIRTIDIENTSLLLTSVRPAAVTIGILFAEFLRALIVVFLPVAILGFGFLSGVDTYAPLVMFPLVTSMFLTSSICCGYVVGAGAAVFSHRSDRKTTRVAGGIALLGAAVIGVAMVRLGGAPELAAKFPSSWYGDLLVVGTPIEESPHRVAGAVLGTVAIGGACGPLVRWFATTLWFDEHNDRDRRSRQSPAIRLSERIRPFDWLRWQIDRPTRCIAWRSIRRTGRNPARVSHLGVPLLISGWLLFELAQTTATRPLLPIAVGLLGTWLVGGFLTLNPLGDDGAALPATLTTSIDGSQFVRGTALISAIIGVPLLVVSVIVVSVPTYALQITAGFAIWIGIHGLVGISIAIAVGMRFPRFSTIRVSGRRDAVPPSLSAISIYSMAVLLLGGFAIIPIVGPQLLLDGSVPTLIGQVMSSLAWLSLESGIGYICYRVAVLQFDRYTLD